MIENQIRGYTLCIYIAVVTRHLTNEALNSHRIMTYIPSFTIASLLKSTFGSTAAALFSASIVAADAYVSY